MFKDCEDYFIDLLITMGRDEMWGGLAMGMANSDKGRRNIYNKNNQMARYSQ